MCFMGGGGSAPQVQYRDNPSPQVVSSPPPPPAPMAGGVGPAGEQTMADVERSQGMGTSIFKINRDPMMSNDYQDQGIDSGISYLG